MSTGEQSRATTAGYLSAVAVMLRTNHDYQTAQHVLRAGGLSEQEIRAADMTEGDTDLLLRALNRDAEVYIGDR